MKDDEKDLDGKIPDDDTDLAEEELQAGTGQKAEPVAEDVDELRQKARERDQYLDMLQRTTADFSNYQKRMHRERETNRQTAIRDFIAAILPALDNLDHAIAAAKDSPDSALLEGVKLARDEMLRVLHNFGVKRMDAAGGKFDPNIHEAVQVQQTDAVPHQTVLEEIRPGYLLNDKPLRAAQVKVSHHPHPDQAAPAESKQ